MSEYRRKPTTDDQIAGLGLFETAQQAKDEGIARGLERQASTAALLEPVVLQLAMDAGPVGITADDVRREAARQGIEPADRGQRTWSFLAGLFRSLMSKGDLYPVGRRNSARRESHANDLVVYVHRRHAEAA